MFLFGGSQEEYEAYQDQHQAARTESYLHTFSVLETLDADQMRQVLGLINASLASPETGHHITGVLTGMLRYHLGLCACAATVVDHTRADHDNPDFIIGHHATGDLPDEALEPVEDKSTPADYYKNLMDYRLVEVVRKDSDDSEKLVLECIGCGLTYPSLEDRMLKEPGIEGCHGCIQVQKTGGGNPWKE